MIIFSELLINDSITLSQWSILGNFLNTWQNQGLNEVSKNSAINFYDNFMNFFIIFMSKRTMRLGDIYFQNQFGGKKIKLESLKAYIAAILAIWLG